MKRFFKILILRVTYPIWHTAVDICIGRCKEKGIINNDQRHEIAALLDRTQKEWYMVERVVNEYT